MPCELIRVNFKKGLVKSRELLGDKAPQFNPYQSAEFKTFTSCLAELAVMTEQEGGNPIGLIAVSVDLEAAMYDENVVDTAAAIDCLKRVVAKLEMHTPDPQPGASA